jgi:hypothetical protein
MGVPGSDTPLGFRAYASRGNVFYVDSGHPDTNDNNDGTDPNAPLRTITEALANCTANQEDYVIVQQFSNALETWPIVMTKSKVHLMPNMYALGVGRTITPPADTAGLYITGDKVEVAGFEIGGGASHGCIEFPTGAQSWGAHIHHNRFAWMTAAQDGIRMTGAVDKVQFLIHDNEFNDKITRDGIRIEQNATRSEIWNNVFRYVGGVGINLVTLCTDIYAIHDNIFRVDGAVQGDAISCNVNSLGCMFWGNQAMHLGAAPAQNPYIDLGANHWGVNWSGDAVTYPV